MKTVKIVLGLLLTFSFMKGCYSLTIEEPNKTAMYTIINAVFLLIPGYLFYSAFKKQKPTDNIDKKELDKF